MAGLTVTSEILDSRSDVGTIFEKLCRQAADRPELIHLSGSMIIRSALAELMQPAFSGSLGALQREVLALTMMLEIGKAIGADADDVRMSRAAASRARAHEIRQMLEAALSSPPSLAAMAAAVGSNETTIRRDFREAFGTTILSYIAERRLEVGRALLRNTGTSVSEIAYRCGFNNVSSFSAAYSRKYGQSPRSDR
jgi:AraC-like DNA-binding protein